MKLLKLAPDVYKFDTAEEFMKFFKVGEGDFILTNEFLKERLI